MGFWRNERRGGRGRDEAAWARLETETFMVDYESLPASEWGQEAKD
jgi:hypothetical protein